MAMIFYSIGYRAKSAQGKGVWGEESQVLKSPLLVEPHKISLIPSTRSSKNISGKLIGNSVYKFFTGDCHRDPVVQNFWLPKENQVFSINNIIHTIRAQ